MFQYIMTIDNLRHDFGEIIQILNKVKVKFDNINTKIKKLKDVYDDLTNSNHDPIYIFGLDFLNFQYKIFHNQYKNLMDMIKLINNRIYGDYYKLCELTMRYITEKMKDTVFLTGIKNDDNELPIYKDLDEYYDYGSETLLSVNARVIGILKKLNSYCIEKDKIKDKHLKLSNSGFFLDNFLHSFETNNNSIRNQLDMYVKNIEFFNKNHKMMLNNMYGKISALYNEIVGNIEFDEEDGSVKTQSSSRRNKMNKVGIGDKDKVMIDDEMSDGDEHSDDGDEHSDDGDEHSDDGDEHSDDGDEHSGGDGDDDNGDNDSDFENDVEENEIVITVGGDNDKQVITF
jgi:hypothetical protein